MKYYGNNTPIYTSSEEKLKTTITLETPPVSDEIDEQEEMEIIDEDTTKTTTELQQELDQYDEEIKANDKIIEELKQRRSLQKRIVEKRARLQEQRKIIAQLEKEISEEELINSNDIPNNGTPNADNMR